MPDISISIVNFNTKENLRRCLESIKTNIQGVSYEIVVVDNYSSDSSLEMLSKEFSDVQVLANSANLGATKAKNQSFQNVQGEYILILDSDVEILPESVERMYDFIRTHEAIGILGPRVLFPNGRQQHSCNEKGPDLLGCFLNKFFSLAAARYTFYRTSLGNWYLKKRYSKPEEFSWLGGMCLLVRREVIEKLGGFDENFFIYYDDTDFCLRAKEAGWKIFYLPEACVIHHMSRSIGQFNPFLYPKFYESEMVFFKKHFGRLQEKACALFILIVMGARLVAFGFLWLCGLNRQNMQKRVVAYGRTFSLALGRLL